MSRSLSYGELSRPERTLFGRFRNPSLGFDVTAVPSGMPLPVAGAVGGFLNMHRPALPPADELEAKLPVIRPTFSAHADPGEVRATWLGHASVLFELDGARVLCDPIFSERTSLLGLGNPKRLRPPPCQIEDLPVLDAVVISHTHYDHLDYDSVLALHKRFPEMLWLVPSGCESWMRGCGPKNVRELTWWEEAPLGERKDFRLAFTPTQHWSGRGPFDRNKCLWGSWALLGPKHRAWFAGDTGYCERYFREIGEWYGPFDVAAIPIGAYEPRWFMGPQHVDPKEAVQIHKDVKAKQSLAIHWGTFRQAGEHVLEPPEKLRTEALAAGLPEGTFRTVRHGESLVLADDGTARIEPEEAPPK